MPNEQELETNRLRVPILAPLRSRHALEALGIHSRVKSLNTIAPEGVDMVEDTRLIRDGYGIRRPARADSAEHFEINGRLYGLEGSPQTNGAFRLYPIRGEGLVEVGRAEYKAILLIIKHGGLTLECEELFKYDPEIDSATVAKAFEVYQMRKRR